MTPYFDFDVRHHGKTFSVAFNRLRRTEHRAKVWPPHAMSAIAASIREVAVPDEAECGECGFGVSYRSSRDSIDQTMGEKLALQRALRVFPKAMRKVVWGEYLFWLQADYARKVGGW